MYLSNGGGTEVWLRADQLNQQDFDAGVWLRADQLNQQDFDAGIWVEIGELIQAEIDSGAGAGAGAGGDTSSNPTKISPILLVAGLAVLGAGAYFVTKRRS